MKIKFIYVAISTDSKFDENAQKQTDRQNSNTFCTCLCWNKATYIILFSIHWFFLLNRPYNQACNLKVSK